MNWLRIGASAMWMLWAGAVLAVGLTPKDEERMRNGMTADELLATFGQPYKRYPAPSRGGSTWVYALEGEKPRDGFVLEVELSSGGQVIGAKRRLVQDVY